MHIPKDEYITYLTQRFSLTLLNKKTHQNKLVVNTPPLEFCCQVRISSLIAVKDSPQLKN